MHNVSLRNTRWRAAMDDRVTRIRVYTLSGTQIGFPGVGDGANRLTFPSFYVVGDALRGTQWIPQQLAEGQVAV